MFRGLGVRTRILAIALIPSLTLLVVGVGAAGYLVTEANTAEDWAAEHQQAIPSTRELLEAAQHERHLTLALLSGDSAVAPALSGARLRLDVALRGLVDAYEGIRDVDEARLRDDVAEFTALMETLTAVRSGIDATALSPADAYLFYNRMLDVIPAGTEVAERTAPDAAIAVRIATGLRLFKASEAMARSTALGALYLDTDATPAIPGEEYIRQIGFYHTEIAALGLELDGAEGQHLQALTVSTAWKQLTSMESAIAARATASLATTSNTSAPSVRSEIAAPLPLSTPEWLSAAAEVNRGLTDAWTAHNRASQKLAEDTAAAAARKSALLGGGVLVVSILAFLVAVAIANRIIRRLKRLRRQTLALADERLPDMMRRLREGDSIDPAAESPALDYGRDEIGQVARAFQHAHSAAVAAAVAEAHTREGVKTVFLNIAHRSQVVAHRQLEILDEAERQQEDPILLDTLFRLDHLATRERRNAENLIILGGGKPGRQWRNPVPLVDVIRSAIGETLDYARVRVARLPEAHVVGTVVADLIHVLAELVDNATSFSPPQSRVEVTANVVGRGVAIEIGDRGMGLAPADRDAMNAMLSNPPDFGVAALSADSRMGLFVVARLAARQGISVRLSESDYGGTLAVVLVPTALLADEFLGAPTPSAGADPQPAHVLPPAAATATEPAKSAQANASSENSATIQPPALPQKGPHPNSGASIERMADGRPALPRRTRQRPLPRHATQPVQKPATTAPTPRSAEHARDLMSAIETGTRRGRRSTVVPDEQEG
ncbi:nitrate- and nitrite sensing domain-containing protein [Nocardia sp. CNY236]|uniref:sensor histidine kinase n=1 Tax=Nocardia sp. CNY236 TaxID=1169152 RepID=UPI00055DF679|nr:nitrate- and nitrite sensing domain-containing protein [Nocardia sp. CNY236]